VTTSHTLQKENFQKEDVKISLPPYIYNYSHSQENSPNNQTLTKKHTNNRVFQRVSKRHCCSSLMELAKFLSTLNLKFVPFG
jgi:hypothetical protein